MSKYGFDFHLNVKVGEEGETTAAKVMERIQTLTNAYNKYAEKNNVNKTNHLYPLLSFKYDFKDGTMIVKYDCSFGEEEGYFTEKRKNKKIDAYQDKAVRDVKEIYEQKLRELESRERQIKFDEEWLIKRGNELDAAWKELESITSKPEVIAKISEAELAAQIEKELRSLYSYELEDLK